MNKKAFTFIELLVVITIITITTISWVFYFSRQVSSMWLSSKITNVKNFIDKLDNDISNKKVFDYKIYFKKNSIWFTGSLNNLWIDYSQKLFMNFDTGTWIIYSHTGWDLKIYSGIKYKDTIFLEDKNNYSYLFNKNIYWKIESSYSWEILNTVFLQYFSEENFDKNILDKLKLIWIYWNSSKTSGNYASLIIQNINWNKKIIADWVEKNKIYLFFEQNWVEKFLEIKK